MGIWFLVRSHSGLPFGVGAGVGAGAGAGAGVGVGLVYSSMRRKIHDRHIVIFYCFCSPI